MNENRVVRQFETATDLPVHGKKPVKPGTLRSLIRKADLTVEQFVALE